MLTWAHCTHLGAQGSNERQLCILCNIGTLRHRNIFTSVAVTDVVEEKITMIITSSTDITDENVLLFTEKIIREGDEYIAKHHLLF